jgi:acyltransferase
MTAPQAGAPAARISFIDVAKGLGILLVFYGHLIECFYKCGLEGAVEQMRWIYCFHMPLFFFLSGLVYKERALPAETFLKRQTLTRLVPAWAFNFLSMVILTFVVFLAGPDRPTTAFATVLKTKAVRFGWETLCGRPFFNVLMWFLICLFVVELIQFALRKRLRRTPWLLVSMVVFGGLTFVFSRYRTFLADFWGSLPFDAGLLKIDFWQFSSAVAAIVFYQAGILLRRQNGLAVASRPLVLVLAGAVGLLITLLTFNLNDARPVVFVAHGGYGNAGWFFLSAFAGIAFVVGLAGLLSFSRVLKKLGQITLGLMCLDGILHGMVNLPLARRVAPLIPEHSILLLTLSSAALTLLSVLVCLPVIWLLERYAPILLGRIAGRSAIGASATPVPEAIPPQR